MAYTYDQLVLAYTAVHDGIAPDAATQATLLKQAALNANGQLTDAQLLGGILNGADSTTALAVLSYQFFTGKSPSKAGLDYLVNSAINTSDLNDPYYSKFSLENRYINFAANLGVQGEGADAFAAKYGALTFGDYVASIYQTIIGAAYASAAGLDAAKAIADITSRRDAIQATAQSAGMITPNMTVAQIDLAVKAATAGYLLGEAIKADVGLYAAAANNFMVTLATGAAVYNTDITQTYAPNASTPARGAGTALDSAPAVLPNPPDSSTGGPLSLTLAAGVNIVTGSDASDTFTGTNVTFTAASVLNGRGGSDTLNLTGSGAAFAVPNATVSSIETVNINNAGPITISSTGWTGVTKLNIIGQGALTVSAAQTTDMAITNANQGSGTIQVNGGHDVTLNVSSSNGPISVGDGVNPATSPTGVVTINRTSADYSKLTIHGGTIIDVTQEVSGFGPQGPEIFVEGSTLTKSVKIKNTGLYSPVTIQDINYGAAAVGTIKTIDIDGLNGVTVLGSAVNTIKVANSYTGMIRIMRAGAFNPATVLSLTLDNAKGPWLTDEGNAYETINITTGARASSLSGIQDTGLRTLNISGASKLDLATLSTATALTTVDASAMTGGGFTWVSGELIGPVTIKGAPTSENVIDTWSALSTMTYIGGTASDTVTVNNKANIVDVGVDSAVDTVRMGWANQSRTILTEIRHMAAGDRLDLFSIKSDQTSLGAPTAMTGSFASALDAAAAGNGLGKPIISWFTWGGDTYVVADKSAGASFVDWTDYVVKLTGTALTSALITGTVLTFA